MATFELDERNGASPGTPHTDVANVNFGSIDAAELVPSSYPITAGADAHSFEKWLRLHLTALGGATVVDNIKVWLSNLGGGYKAGEGVSTNARTSSYGGAATYPVAGPVNTNSPIATQVMPTSEPIGPNIGIGGLLSGSLTAVGYTDYIVLQLDVSASTPSGALNQKTITFQWDEA